jgi:hypothetical protein
MSVARKMNPFSLVLCVDVSSRGCPFLECSAKFNENIMQTFTQLLTEIEKQTAPAKQDESCALM